MTQDSKKTKLMKSFLSEDLPESPKLDNSSKISSTEKNPIPESTLMKLLLMELPFKEELFVETPVKKLNLWLLLMPPL
jgi:hypothetical protein